MSIVKATPQETRLHIEAGLAAFGARLVLDTLPDWVEHTPTYAEEGEDPPGRIIIEGRERVPGSFLEELSGQRRAVLAAWTFSPEGEVDA